MAKSDPTPPLSGHAAQQPAKKAANPRPAPRPTPRPALQKKPAVKSPKPTIFTDFASI